MSLDSIHDVGWVVPEEIVLDALRDGLAEIRAAVAADGGHESLRRIFRGVPDERFERIRKYFAEPDRAISIELSWPRDAEELPAYAIITDSDKDEQFLGDFGGEVLGEDGEHIPFRAECWRTTIAVVAHDINADTTRWLCQLAKWVLSRRRVALSEGGFRELSLGGRDLTPDTRFADGSRGHIVYRAAVTVTAAVHQTMIESDQTDEISEVQADGDVVGSIAANFTPPA